MVKLTILESRASPVPAAANNKNSELLISLLQGTRPDRVIFLGDLFHSHYNEEWEVLGQIRKHFLNCSFELVLGNHDILSALQYERNKMKCYANELREGDFILTHEPMPDVPEGFYNLSGHLHPGVKLKGTGKQTVMLPCFYFAKNQGILPAFGSFTGMARIMPKKEDRVFVLAEDKIIDYSHGEV
ncbi:MAG: ligase-associated DNA damage response endonuclease PdeM [Cytophagales bacterium]|nr:ligase-associated DNA damage response endonuclease PdeM [Cytophagales bacterium]